MAEPNLQRQIDTIIITQRKILALLGEVMTTNVTLTASITAQVTGLEDILAVLETIRDTTTAEDTLEKIIEIADNIEIMRNAL